MTRKRQAKIDNIEVPDLEVIGDKDDADLLIVGFGSTYGHLHAAMDEMRAAGKKVVVAEQNMGQLAGYLRMKVDNFVPAQFNQVKGQPFVVAELVEAFNALINK